MPGDEDEGNCCPVCGDAACTAWLDDAECEDAADPLDTEELTKED